MVGAQGQGRGEVAQRALTAGERQDRGCGPGSPHTPPPASRAAGPAPPPPCEQAGRVWISGDTGGSQAFRRGQGPGSLVDFNFLPKLGSPLVLRSILS